MLYGIVAPADAPWRAVKESLASLVDALPEADPGPLFLLYATPEPSDTMRSICGQLSEWNAAFEIVCEEGVSLDASFNGSEQAHAANRPFARMADLLSPTGGLRQEGEDAVLLVVVDQDADVPDELAFLITKCSEVRVPVRDLGDALVEVAILTIEDDLPLAEMLVTPPDADIATTTIELPTEEATNGTYQSVTTEFGDEDEGAYAVVVPLALVDADDDYDSTPQPVTEHDTLQREPTQEHMMEDATMGTAVLTRNELAGKSRDELKALVKRFGVENTVADMRSKDAMIAALTTLRAHDRVQGVSQDSWSLSKAPATQPAPLPIATERQHQPVSFRVLPGNRIQLDIDLGSGTDLTIQVGVDGTITFG